MTGRSCETCHAVENFPADSKSELRPYGPGGSLICFRCATATPEANAAAGAVFGALLDANEAVSPTATTMLTADGPVPIDAEQLDAEISRMDE